MRGFVFRQVSLTLRFTFVRVLPLLPGPGTPAFAMLCRELPPYGFSASGVAVESPTSRLSDVSVVISLLNQRAELRLLYGWFEVALFRAFDDDMEALSGIVEIVWRALREVDNEAHRGRLRIDCTAHLELEPGEAEAYLREHLPSGDAVLVPDAFAFRLTTEEAEELRVVVAKSLRFDHALFVDYSIGYRSMEAVPRIRDLQRHYDSALAKLGLEALAQPEAIGDE